MGFATPPQVGTTRPRPLSNNLPLGEHTRARLLSSLKPMMDGSGSITAQEAQALAEKEAVVTIQVAMRGEIARRAVVLMKHIGAVVMI